jgi:hypothetical protein
MTCDLKNHPKACVITQTKYKRPECKGCTTGEKHLRAQSPSAHAPTDTNEKNDLTEKKEAPVATDLRQRILETIIRRQPCSSAPILQNLRISAKEFRPIAEELAQEKKIAVWSRGRKVLYTLAGANSPFAEASEGTEAVPQEKREKKKRSSRVRSVEAPAAKASADNPLYAAILELETQKDVALRNIAAIDRALEALRGIE